MNQIGMDKIKEICKKWNLTELNFTKGIFIDDKGITVDLRGDRPIIGVTIAGTLYTEGHGNLRVPDLEVEIMNVLKPFLKPTKKPVRIDETSQSSKNDKNKVEVKDDSHKITQRKSDDQINVTTRPQEQTTKGEQESSFFKSQSTEKPPRSQSGELLGKQPLLSDKDKSKLGTPDNIEMTKDYKGEVGWEMPEPETKKEKLHKAVCKECKGDFEITLDTAAELDQKYGGIYCHKCRDEIDKGLNQKEPAKMKEKVPTPKIKTCTVCGNELSGARALECYQKEKEFVCEECDENKGDKIMDEKLPIPTGTGIETENENKLTVTKIKRYLCPTATDAEAYNFLQLCVHRDLNPFLKEAYLIKYGSMPATMVVGKDAFTKKAEESGKLDGFEAGIIIKTSDGKIERRIGVVQFEGDILIGGWAKIFRKDMKYPFVCEVPLSEYMKYKDGKPQSSWATMPGTMIRKVSLVQALREAFTRELGGCYDAVEMGAQDGIK
jgi:phage recombination protein Bet